MRCSVCDAVVMTITNGNYYCPTCHSFYEFKNCDMPFPHVVQYGWICPRCGKVNSPDARSCDCSSGGATITTNTDGEKRIEYINQTKTTCNTETIEYIPPRFTPIDIKDTVCTDIKKEY